jgi:hypothetical protein
MARNVNEIRRVPEYTEQTCNTMDFQSRFCSLSKDRLSTSAGLSTCP